MFDVIALIKWLLHKIQVALFCLLCVCICLFFVSLLVLNL
jgi:hypothetical protein